MLESNLGTTQMDLSQKVSQVKSKRKRILGRESNTHKGFEEGMCLVCFKD